MLFDEVQIFQGLPMFFLKFTNVKDMWGDLMEVDFVMLPVVEAPMRIWRGLEWLLVEGLLLQMLMPGPAKGAAFSVMLQVLDLMDYLWSRVETLRPAPPIS